MVVEEDGSHHCDTRPVGRKAEDVHDDEKRDSHPLWSILIEDGYREGRKKERPHDARAVEDSPDGEKYGIPNAKQYAKCESTAKMKSRRMYFLLSRV